MNHQILSLIQIVLSIVLVGLILIQAKGTGLGSTFGGEMGFYRTKRGAERVLFYLTIFISFFFVLAALAVFVI